jgi:hypothetical protein
VRTTKVILSLVLLLGGVYTPLRAQTATSATVLGRVTDKTGGVLAGARVSLHNLATNSNREQKTNAEGVYVYADIAPGTYILTVKKDGFQSATVQDLQLSVNKSYTVDVSLESGDAAIVMEVSTEAHAELQTTDATVGDVIGGKEIVRLPTRTRDASELLTLQPGATPVAGAGDVFSTNGGTVSGARADQNDVTLDGIDITNNSSWILVNSIIIPLGVDSVSEFRVGVSNPNATFGRAAGAQVSVASRSGSNDFHGVAYWYFQNSALNANSWDNNAFGIARPTIRDNRGGFAVGGPIQKDKTFFFATYEPRRFYQSVGEERIVPSDTLRGLNPAYPHGALTFNGTTYDLAATDPRGIGLSPTVKALWAMLPSGNDPTQGDGVNFLGYKFNAPAPLTDDNFSFKLDHNFGQNLHFFGRYAYARDLNPAGEDQVNLIGASAGAAKLDATRNVFGDGAILGLDWIIRGNLINSVHFGRIRERINSNSVKASVLASQYNLTGTDSADGSVFLEPGYFGAPFGNLLALPVDSNTPGAIRGKTYNSNVEIRDDLNWIKGKHTWVYGADIHWIPAYYQADDRRQGPRNSIQAVLDADQQFLSLTNADRPAAVTAAGLGTNWDRLYAAALGLVDSTAVTVVRDANLNPLPIGTPITENARSRSYDFYAQDSWRMRPGLTLTYGLAYGWQTPPSESQGRFSVLTDTNGKPIDPLAYLKTREADAANGQIYNPTFGYVPYRKLGMSGPWNTDYSNIAPRVSLAWNPSASEGFFGKLLGQKKTVIRGGYGIAYDRVDAGSVVVSSMNEGFSQNLQLPTPACNTNFTVSGCNAASADPVASTFRVGVDGTIPVPAADTAKTIPYIPATNGEFWVVETDPNFKVGREHLLDFTIQRELPKNLLMEIGYVGRLGRRLPSNVTLNQSPYMFKDVTTVAGTPGSGQSFAQAFVLIAAALRAGQPVTSLGNQPWFENQLPAGWGAATCGSGFTNTQCIANNHTQDFIFGGVTNIFSDMGGIRSSVGLPAFTNQQQQDLGVHVSNDISNYHAAVFTLRNRGWHGLTFDMNYTFSKSLDQEGRIQTFTNGYFNSFNPRASYGPSYYDRTHVYNALFSYDLPFGRGHQLKFDHKVADQVIGGWHLAGIFRAASGVPLVAAQSGLAFGGGIVTSNNVDEIPTVNPSSLGGGLHSGVTGSAAPCLGAGQFAGTGSAGTGLNYFANPGAAYCSFRPILLASDNASGRGNPLRGFGSWNQDLSIGKTTVLTERTRLEFSADFFNLFNNVTFADPGVGGSASFMDMTNPAAFGVVSAQAVPGNRLSGSRWIQLGLRVSF